MSMPCRLTIGAGPDTIGSNKPIAATGLYGLPAVEELLLPNVGLSREVGVIRMNENIDVGQDQVRDLHEAAGIITLFR